MAIDDSQAPYVRHLSLMTGLRIIGEVDDVVRDEHRVPGTIGGREFIQPFVLAHVLARRT